MTLEALAKTTGESLERLQQWQQLGLLPDASQATAPERVRTIRFVEDHGITAEKLAAILRDQGDLLASYIDQLHGPKHQLHRQQRIKPISPEDLVSSVSLEPDTLERIALASGARADDGIDEEDAAALQAVATALDAGFPEEALLQTVHVLATSTGKAAEAASRLFHFYVHEQLRADGVRGAQLMAATDSVADPLTELLEPSVLYFFRKAWKRAMREDLLVHLRQETSAPSPVPGEVFRTIVFVDLSSFTALTEAMGDTVAADVLGRFAELVRDLAASCEGEIVKQLGDGFMLTFLTADAALQCALELERQVSMEPRFPAVRIGAHAGTVLYRAGDYVGTNVNIAARVAATAQRHQVLITNAVRADAKLSDVDYLPAGQRRLKGLTQDIELFHATRQAPTVERLLDPVCGMELDASTTEAQLHWRHRQLGFCSSTCLKHFLENPDRYDLAP